MTLIAQIKQRQVKTRKARLNIDDAKITTINDQLGIHGTLLTALIGEAEMVGKNKRNGPPSDEEVRAVIIKFIKGNTENIQLLEGGDNRANQFKIENDLLNSYLPQQMSAPELCDAIAAIGSELGLSSPRDMGTLMKTLKERHNGMYDGKSASQLVKDYLNG
jgi:uncharacterized protein YqeY